MPTVLLSIAYALLIFLAAMAGGLAPLWFRLSHTRMQLALSFVAGVMIGVGLLHLLPHAMLEVGSIERVAWWMLIGFLLLFFLERLFHFHHHDIALEDDEAPHDHAHHHGEHCEQAASEHGGPSFSWTGAAIGLAVHSLIDGLALGAAVTSEATESAWFWPAGLGAFLAIILHKPFDSLTIGTLMAAGGWSARARMAVNVAYAIVVPLGMLLFFVGFQQLDEAGHELLGCALAVAAGAFLCIATSDLLPELQFHSHDRVKLSLALLLGVGLAWAIEHYGHNHAGHEAQHMHEHAH